jgi:hypothetical protein
VLGDGLSPFQVVAVFEVEGFDVPLNTISLHSEVYPQVRKLLQAKFPCYVPIYTLATHRPNYGQDAELVQRCVLERQARAAQHGNSVQVCDGAQRDSLVLMCKRSIWCLWIAYSEILLRQRDQTLLDGMNGVAQCCRVEMPLSTTSF